MSLPSISKIKFLVAGYSGFIGGHLVKILMEQSVDVRGLTRYPNYPHPMTGVELIHGDLSQAESLAGILEGIDTVIHAAGYAHSHRATDDIHRRATVEGTRHLLSEAEKHSVQRFIFISSVKAMPEPGDRCLDESDQGQPADAYGLSRREAEDLVLEAGHRNRMHVSILRPALVYGAGCKGNLLSMMRWIERGLFPPVPDTKNIRSMVDVRDLVRAILLAAERPEANGQIFIITDGEFYSTHRIYAALRSAFGKPVPRWSVPAGVLRGLGRAGDAFESILGRPIPFNSALCSRLLDSACYRSIHAEQLLGFRPEYCFEDAVPAMVTEYLKGHPGSTSSHPSS